MFFLKLFSRLPFPILYLFSDFLFLTSYYLIQYRRKVVRKNLRLAFPDMMESQISQIEKKFYHNLCDYVVETLKLLTLSPKELKQRMHFKNPELVNDYARQGMSMLFLASHQFNWEWLIASANLWLSFPMDYVYQAQRSEFVNQFSLLTRSRFGSKAIKRAEVAREMIRGKDIIRGVAVVADQFPGHGHDKRYWTTFLNQDTAFFEAVNNLAIMTNYPVFFARIKHLKRGYYEMEFVKIGEPPYEKNSFAVIENYIKETEKVIHQYPAGWLWSHNRWKKGRNDP